MNNAFLLTCKWVLIGSYSINFVKSAVKIYLGMSSATEYEKRLLHIFSAKFGIREVLNWLFDLTSDIIAGTLVMNGTGWRMMSTEQFFRWENFLLHRISKCSRMH